MAKPYKTACFVFRRDLRLHDNTGLLRAFDLAERVLPCFIFDPRQQPPDNAYFSAHGFQFLIESLEDLERQLAARDGKLYRFHGPVRDTLVDLIEGCGVEAVFVNRDYTPFSRRRDGEIETCCAARGVHFEACDDALLNAPEAVMTESATPFVVFTPYYRRACARAVAEPVRFAARGFFREQVARAHNKTLYDALLPERVRGLHVHGGRARGAAILAGLDAQPAYVEYNNQPAVAATTSLSAHHKFGTLSAREVFHSIERRLGAAGEALVRQLYWRDFYTQLSYYHPRVFAGALKRKLDDLEWDANEAGFEAWCQGQTGFPLVDAGMRQLNRSGWMHNRVRLVVGAFLAKDLHIHWRRGEHYFARRLVDYDPCVNNGNWQWVASVGADTRPLRIFNPWTQQQRYDPDCAYIKHWVAELREVEPAVIHKLHERPLGLLGDYPAPILDHAQETRATRERYARVL